MTTSAPFVGAHPPPLPPVDLERVLSVLEDVESTEPSAAGAYVFQRHAEPCGMVLVEGGRACWAAARGHSRRLTDLLRSESPVPLGQAALEAVYQRCRDSGVPLGETLVKEGVVGPELLRRVLRQHTAESLVRLCASCDGARAWVPRRAQGYSAAFTFSSAEILVTTLALVHPEPARQARALLRSWSGGLGVAAAFTRSDASRPLPVAVVGNVDVRQLVELGAWATGLLDVSSAVSPERKLVMGESSMGEATVVWSRRELIFVGVASTRHPLQKIIALALSPGFGDDEEYGPASCR